MRDSVKEMKSLYGKGKGKIYPSPSSCQGAPPVGGGGRDVLAVLRLLPAAILVLTAALKAQDREVLAYLVTRSLQGPGWVAAQEKRRCWRMGNHQPLFSCGCFDCYTSYWFRWDSSPDRELIHQAIEGFEEHLATSEKRQPAGKSGRRRDRKEKAKAESEEKGKGKTKPGKEDEKKKKKRGTSLSSDDGTGTGEEGPSAVVISSFHGEEETERIYHAELVLDGGDDPRGDEERGEAARMEMVAVAQQLGSGVGVLMRGWPDVMSLFNSRFWSLWNPGV